MSLANNAAGSEKIHRFDQLFQFANVKKEKRDSNCIEIEVNCIEKHYQRHN